MSRSSKTALLAIFLSFFFPLLCWPLLKQHYGGNLKVAEDLLFAINSHSLFDAREVMEETSIAIDLPPMDPTELNALVSPFQAMNEPQHPCHWILDYPYLNHHHESSFRIEGHRMVIQSNEADYLREILQSRCLAPDRSRIWQPFVKTQFGYEANKSCLAGRPFLDSITGVPVDSTNPLLSFKLHDVDIMQIPEERYSQMKNDPGITLLPGVRYFLYFVTDNVTQEQVTTLVSALDLKEISKAILNDHVEILLPETQAAPPFSGAIRVVLPEERPYKLAGERMLVQMRQKGISLSNTTGIATIELKAEPIEEASFDLFRYKLLRNVFQIRSDRAWFEEWDEMETNGKIVPLLIHTSYIGARKNIQDLRIRKDGTPDLANAWILLQ